MIAFEGLLVAPAEAAGIKVPPDPEEYDPKEFVHFHVFCNVQLGTNMPSAEAPFVNARIIAELTEVEVLKVTLFQLIARGLAV